MKYLLCLTSMLLIFSGCPAEKESRDATVPDDRAWIEVSPRVQRQKSLWGHGDDRLKDYFREHGIEVHGIRRTSRGEVCRGLNCPTGTRIEILVDKKSIQGVYKAVPYLQGPL